MRRTIDLTLSVTGLFALISAAGCSSEPEGNNGNAVTPFGQAGASATPGGGGASGGTGVVGGAGTTGAPGEGQGGSSFNAGMAGTGSVGAAGTGGTAGLLPSGPVNGYFTSGPWKGYAWTGTETPSAGTTIVPTEFTTLPQGEPFCVSGAVAPEPAYQGVSLLGFNINQGDVPEEGQAEPPVLAITPTGTGIAINFTKTTASILRIQIQGPTGETNENDRWCYEIGETAGPIHALYSDFNTRCWVTAATATPENPVGVDYAMQPIEAVVFTVPGDDNTPTPYNYCIAGFADGDGPEDAAQFSSGGGGLLTGTIVDNFGRQKVIGNDNKSYVIQNNAWNAGAQEGAQQVQFSGNSFTVSRQTNPSFGNIPISFPSIFVGGNGNQGNNGSLATTDDNLPQAINALTSVNTTFRHNGGAGPQGEYNVTYDIWFANTPPTGAYDDASAAFLMVWLYKPGGKNPIGLSPAIPNVSIPGSNVMWDIWVGARGENGAEDNLNNDAPVISYVPQSTIGNFQADLMNFINDAVARSAAGTLRAPNNGRTFTFGNNLVLTDIFGGAEIWSGAQGLTVSEFTVNVQ